VKSFADAIEDADVLVNNAGLASGFGPLEEMDEERARLMWDTNVMGVLRVTQALLPNLEASGHGHIINIGSTAGRETYRGGGGYTASKHALYAMTRTLRLELLGRPVRVTEIAPGMVETEFSVVRFDGDTEKAKKLYEGLTPLTAEDIADCVAWAATRPPHVNIDEIVLRPLGQATSWDVDRSGRL
jgi:NADP-dependent 3-hydroxy acid dehydrogenase YdfG